MDRTEKRRLERERQKLDKHNLNEDAVNRQWFSQLPVSRKIFIGKFIEKKTIENDNLVAMILDKCMMGAIDNNINIDDALMKKIIKESNDYIADYKEYLDKNGYEEGFNMIENTKIREEVAKKIKVMIKGDVEKIKGMALLKKEYNLPGTELSNMWITCKVELDQEKKKAQHKKGRPEKETLKWEESDKSKKVGVVTNVVSINGLELTVEPINNSLEIIDEVKVIKGKFGVYHKSKDGIRFSNGEKLVNNDIAYKTKDELVINRNKLNKECTDRVDLINRQIEELNKELEMANKAQETMKEHFSEIEQVFDM